MLKKRLGLEVIERNWKGKYTYNFFKIPSTLIIPEGCEKIGDNVFWGCRNLKDVVIPESVKRIGNSAFCNCWWLEKVVIPRSVKWIGYSAFYCCKNAVVTLEKPESKFEFIAISAFSGCKCLLYAKEKVRN